MYIDSFMATLPIMGKGMLGIFVVTALIIAGVYLMNALSSGGADKDA